MAYGARHTLKEKLVKVVSDRIPGTGSKQFIRFSTSSSAGNNASFDFMGAFATKWLDLDVVSAMQP